MEAKTISDIRKSYPYLFTLLGLSISIAMSFGKIFEANINWFTAFVFGLVVLALYKVCKEGKSKLLLIPIALLTLLGLYTYLYRPLHFYGTIIKLDYFSWWFKGLFSLESEVNSKFAALMTYMTIPPLFLVNILLARRGKGYGLMIIPSLVLFTIHWMYFSVSAWQYALVYGLLIIFLYSLDNYMAISSYANKNKLNMLNYSFKSWCLMAMNLIIILFLVVLVMPKDIKPLEWEWVDRQIGKLDGIFSYEGNVGREAIRSFGKYGVDMMGYQRGPSVLGGPITPGNHMVLKVKSPVSTYLRGSIKTKYTGNSWEYVSYYEETFPGSITIDVAYGQEVKLQHINVSVEVVDISTTSVFLPLQPRYINARTGELVLTNDLEVFKKDREFRSGDTYSVLAAIPTVDREILEKTPFVRENQGGEFSNLYLSIPVDYPQAVKQLVAEITSPYQNPYDKAIAIREYLRNNYQYNLSPSVLPQGRDFVEHFLFTEKSGYCTYFASSMAVMARLAGIPSRYVEGFIMPEAPMEGDIYNITADRAHAWAELYFQGYGWLPFEATPAYSLGYEAVIVPEQSSIEDLLYEDGGDMERLLNRLNREEDTPDPQENIDAQPVISDWAEDGKESTIILFIVAMLVCIAIGVLWYIKLRGLDISRYSHNAEKSYLIILAILDKVGYFRFEGETLLEYSSRIGQSSIAEEINFSNLTNLYYRVRYGKKDITFDEINQLGEGVKILNQRLKQNLGWFKYRLEMTGINKKITG